MTRLRRPLILLAALLVSGGLSACGTHLDETARVVEIESEGLYLNVGEMKYQVQISRQLNPYDTQDAPYVAGVPADQRDLEPDEVWFGIFIQVQNEAAEPMRPSGDIKIVDTQEETFRPLSLPDSNEYAYRPGEPIPPGKVIPLRDTPGYDTPIRGALLLFKLTLTALDNRPLELIIDSPSQTGIIVLDV